MHETCGSIKSIANNLSFKVSNTHTDAKRSNGFESFLCFDPEPLEVYHNKYKGYAEDMLRQHNFKNYKCI